MTVMAVRQCGGIAEKNAPKPQFRRHAWQPHARQLSILQALCNIGFCQRIVPKAECDPIQTSKSPKL